MDTTPPVGSADYSLQDPYTPPFLVGQRVYMRHLHPSDARHLTRWMNDPEVTQFIAMVPPPTYEEELEWISKMRSSKKDLVLAVCLRSTKQIIGVMGLHKIDYRNGTATTGAVFGDVEQRGQGYGTEAKHLLLKHAFHTLGLRKICSEVSAFNAASLAYQKKCGYRVVGCRKNHSFSNGIYYDQILTEVFREQWEEVVRQ